MGSAAANSEDVGPAASDSGYPTTQTLTPPSPPTPPPPAPAVADVPRRQRRRISLPRRHLIGLAVIALLGLLRGLFWTVNTEIWNPMDEAHHYAYVQSMATGNGIPTVGTDKVSPEVLHLIKDTHTFIYRTMPRRPDVDDPVWQSDREQFEAIQPPLYYALMTPAYWASRPFGLVASIYGVRLASLLVSLTAIPLTWLLARELFPRRPVIWLAAPAVLVSMQGFNMTLATVTNDALLVPVAAAALLASARLWRGLTHRRAAVAGLCLGAALLTKTSTVGLIPLMGLLLLWMVVTRRERLRTAVKTSFTLAGAAGVVVLPWLLWNQLTYGAPSAAGALETIRTSNWVREPFALDVVRSHLQRVRMGFWDGQLRGMGINPYSLLFEKVFVLALVAGVVAFLWQRRGRDLRSLVWVWAALPVAFVGMELMIQLVLGGNGEPYGRHLYLALAPASIAIAAGFIGALGRRWGVVALLVVAALAFTHEQTLVHRYIDDTYVTGLIDPDLAPVVDQSWNDETVTTGAVVVESSPCSVAVIGLLLGDPPPVIGVDGGTPATGRFAGTSDTTFGELFAGGQTAFSLYELDGPVSAPFEVRFPGPTAIGSAQTPRDSGLSFLEGPGEPVARLYCPVEDPEALRFAQLYEPHHLPGISFGMVRAWPVLWAGAAWLAVAAAVVLQLGRWLRSRLRPRQAAPH